MPVLTQFSGSRSMQNRVLSRRSVVRTESSAAASSSRNSMSAKPGRRVAAVAKVFTSTSEAVISTHLICHCGSGRNVVTCLGVPDRACSVLFWCQHSILQARISGCEHLVLVATFKPAIGSFCLELPTGPMLANQTVQDVAIHVVKDMTNYAAAAPVEGNISSWLPEHPDLCSDCVAMVQLVAHVNEKNMPQVVAATTQVRDPLRSNQMQPVPS